MRALRKKKNDCRLSFVRHFARRILQSFTEECQTERHTTLEIDGEFRHRSAGNKTQSRCIICTGWPNFASAFTSRLSAPAIPSSMHRRHGTLRRLFAAVRAPLPTPGPITHVRYTDDLTMAVRIRRPTRHQNSIHSGRMLRVVDGKGGCQEAGCCAADDASGISSSGGSGGGKNSGIRRKIRRYLHSLGQLSVGLFWLR